MILVAPDKPGAANLSGLPPELLERILDFSCDESLIALARTSSRFTSPAQSRLFDCVHLDDSDDQSISLLPILLAKPQLCSYIEIFSVVLSDQHGKSRDMLKLAEIIACHIPRLDTLILRMNGLAQSPFWSAWTTELRLGQVEAIQRLTYLNLSAIHTASSISEIYNAAINLETLKICGPCIHEGWPAECREDANLVLQEHKRIRKVELVNLRQAAVIAILASCQQTVEGVMINNCVGSQLSGNLHLLRKLIRLELIHRIDTSLAHSIIKSNCTLGFLVLTDTIPLNTCLGRYTLCLGNLKELSLQHDVEYIFDQSNERTAVEDDRGRETAGIVELIRGGTFNSVERINLSHIVQAQYIIPSLPPATRLVSFNVTHFHQQAFRFLDLLQDYSHDLSRITSPDRCLVILVNINVELSAAVEEDIYKALDALRLPLGVGCVLSYKGQMRTQLPK